ncbi:hypothetical protein JTB14_036146 [Gonioctena quinquepunctata]|nr:hypothetical protein JTB14_036146 [Gonioctena quinquepunctata]
MYPIIRDIFQDIDLAPSFETDRPNQNSPGNAIAPLAPSPDSNNDILAPDDETLQLSSLLLNQDTEKAGHLTEAGIETYSQISKIDISQAPEELATMTPTSLGLNGAHERNDVYVEQSTPKPSTPKKYACRQEYEERKRRMEGKQVEKKFYGPSIENKNKGKGKGKKK